MPLTEVQDKLVLLNKRLLSKQEELLDGLNAQKPHAVLTLLYDEITALYEEIAYLEDWLKDAGPAR